MRKIHLGYSENGDRVELDFEKEKINFVALFGHTGTGKTLFLYNLIKELSEKYSPDEVGFVLLDMTVIDFAGWKSDYLFKPVIKSPKEAIQALCDLAAQKPKKRIFVLIEECDMVSRDRKVVEAALRKLREMKNVFIVYSASRIDEKFLDGWMREFIDLKVVFFVGEQTKHSRFLLGNDSASQLTRVGGKILAFNGMQICCQPFSKKEVKLLDNFKL